MCPDLPAPMAPSGRQFVIAHGADHAVVTEMGATLRTYTRADRAVIDGFDEGEICPSGRGQVLAPWPNRLGGRYRFEGRSGRPALDEPDRGNAIHGLVRWQPWEVRSQAQNVLVLGTTLWPTPAYPWRLGLELEYRLGRGGLSIGASAVNLDDEPAPFGIGFHPYLTVGTPTVDTARLHLPARQALRFDERGLPTGEQSVSGSELDFTGSRPVGPVALDTAYTALARDRDGLVQVSLRHPDEDRVVTLWMDKAFGYLMAYTGDTLQPPERRRRAIALEPMTCPPDALRTGTDLVRLEPGATWQGTWGISPD